MQRLVSGGENGTRTRTGDYPLAKAPGGFQNHCVYQFHHLAGPTTGRVGFHLRQETTSAALSFGPNHRQSRQRALYGRRGGWSARANTHWTADWNIGHGSSVVARAVDSASRSNYVVATITRSVSCVRQRRSRMVVSGVDLRGGHGRLAK